MAKKGRGIREIFAHRGHELRRAEVRRAADTLCHGLFEALNQLFLTSDETIYHDMPKVFRSVIDLYKYKASFILAKNFDLEYQALHRQILESFRNKRMETIGTYHLQKGQEVIRVVVVFDTDTDHSHVYVLYFPDADQLPPVYNTTH